MELGHTRKEHIWACLDARGKYLPQGKCFTPSICLYFLLGVLGLRGKCGCRWKREGWGPPQICSNLLPFRSKWN
jgi:hypothetical protein